MKNKAELEEIDSLSNFINELYDKISELERNGGGVGTTDSQTSRPAPTRSSLGGA